MNWRRARVAEWATLEMSYIRKGIRGSNPLASANLYTASFPPRPAKGGARRLPRF